MMKILTYFHKDQLLHKPLYEWSFGEKILHPETTSRAESIFHALKKEPNLFHMVSPKHIPVSAINRIHDKNLLTLYKTAMHLALDQTYYPSVFLRKGIRANAKNLNHAGFYCFDSGTPLNATTYSAAGWSAACALKAAQALSKNKSSLTYALCRPPGHHAMHNLFGGYCYLNNAAIAADHLSQFGSVAILDIDFHHGNGTQEIFYQRRDVMMVSLHGDPRDFYPYFYGHKHEQGEKEGKGYNINIPLPSGTSAHGYLLGLKKAISIIRSFKPKFLVVSAGFDTYLGDPVGRFALETPDYQEIGNRISKLKLPTAIIQEGGYAADMLGENVVSLLRGFMH